MRNYERMTAPTGALRPSDYVLARALATNTAESFTVPALATVVVFSSPAGFYANYTTTATVPGDVTDGTASEYIPAGEYERRVHPADTISIISGTAQTVTASFYQL